MTFKANCPIVLIKSEDDIEEFMNMLRSGSTVGFQIDMSIDRMKSHDMVDLINQKYQAMVANTNMKSARVA